MYLNNSITANAFLSVFVSTMLWLEAESVQEKLVRSGFAWLPRGFQAFDNVLHGDQGVPGIRSGGQDLHGNQGFQASDKDSAWQPRGSLQHIRTIRAREGQNRKCGS